MSQCLPRNRAVTHLAAEGLTAPHRAGTVWLLVLSPWRSGRWHTGHRSDGAAGGFCLSIRTNLLGKLLTRRSSPETARARRTLRRGQGLQLGRRRHELRKPRRARSRRSPGRVRHSRRQPPKTLIGATVFQQPRRRSRGACRRRLHGWIILARVRAVMSKPQQMVTSLTWVRLLSSARQCLQSKRRRSTRPR